MIVAIAKLRDVLMEMAQRDAVILSKDATLQQTPERFDGVGVNFAIGIADLVIDDLMRHEVLYAKIPAVFICDENGVSNVHIVAHHLGKTYRSQLGLVHGPRNDSSATLNHADHWRFVGSTSTLMLSSSGPIAFAGFAADVALVHFDDALEQLALLEHGITNTHSHEPCCVFVNFQIAPQLPSRDAFLGIQQKGDGEKPLLQVQMRVMENSVNSDAEGCIAAIAVMPVSGFGRCCAIGFAVWADRLALPTDTLKMGDAISFGGELFVN